MTKRIETLVPDIYQTLTEGVEVPSETAREFGERLSKIISDRLSLRREPPRLRVSNLGEKCLRKLWYSVNRPDLAEPLSGPNRLKFLFGDILESLLLFLAKVSGHTVTHEQHEIEIDGVLGHTDALVDGELVDCKSASTASFNKFSEHRLDQDDPFGYLVQLGVYGSRIGTGSNHFLAVDKTLGNLCLDTHPKAKINTEELVASRRRVLSGSMPPRGYDDEPHQKSGNRKLGVACSYCSFKHSCWPGLRVAYYSDRPVYLTRVVREPKVRVE